MAEGVVTVNLQRMVDLALGHPEVGAVNFNIMHALLHTILRESGLTSTELEFHGADAELLKSLEKIKPVQSHYILSDYRIPDKEKKDESKGHRILIQPGSKLNDLEEKVNGLNKTIHELLKISSTETLIKSVQKTDQTNSDNKLDETGLMPTPTNMWHLLTVEKRVEATEQGIDKLTSIIEELAKQNATLGGSIELIQVKQPVLQKATNELKKQFSVKKMQISSVQELLGDEGYDERLNEIAENMTALTERVLDLEKRYVEVVGYQESEYLITKDESTDDENRKDYSDEKSVGSKTQKDPQKTIMDTDLKILSGGDDTVKPDDHSKSKPESSEVGDKVQGHSPTRRLSAKKGEAALEHQSSVELSKIARKTNIKPTKTKTYPPPEVVSSDEEVDHRTPKEKLKSEKKKREYQFPIDSSSFDGNIGKLARGESGKSARGESGKSTRGESGKSKKESSKYDKSKFYTRSFDDFDSYEIFENLTESDLGYKRDENKSSFESRERGGATNLSSDEVEEEESKTDAFGFMRDKRDEETSYEEIPKKKKSRGDRKGSDERESDSNLIPDNEKEKQYEKRSSYNSSENGDPGLMEQKKIEERRMQIVKATRKKDKAKEEQSKQDENSSSSAKESEDAKPTEGSHDEDDNTTVDKPSEMTKSTTEDEFKESTDEPDEQEVKEPPLPEKESEKDGTTISTRETEIEIEEEEEEEEEESEEEIEEDKAEEGEEEREIKKTKKRRKKDKHPELTKKDDQAMSSRMSMNKAIDKLKDRSIVQVGLEELLGRKGSLIDALNEIDILKSGYNKMKKDLQDMAVGGKLVSKEDKQLGDDTSICEKIEPCLDKIQTQINQLDAMFNNQVEELQQQMQTLELEQGILIEKVNAGLSRAEDQTADVGGFADIYNKINKIQNEITQVSALSSSLQEDKEDREEKIEALIESINFLKSIKADKEEIEDALADKADQQAVNRKVSHDQFDAACDDLSRSLEDALLKLTQQEEFWNETLETIQNEVENKLDKVDIQPLHDFVISKLKTIHQRLKALAALKKEAEAAGTKTKLLKDVNCLSCDKPATMRRDARIPSIPERPSLPPNRSMKAYLTYELDCVRKQRRKAPIHRNLNNIEAAREMPVNDDDKVLTTEHLCSRYCGGSHTLTSPTQRVTHTSHYAQPIGPEAVPLMEGYAKGNDGKMYKMRQEDFGTSSMKPYSSAAPSQVSDKNQSGDPTGKAGDGNVKSLGITTLYKPCTCKPASTSRLLKKTPFKGPPRK